MQVGFLGLVGVGVFCASNWVGKRWGVSLWVLGVEGKGKMDGVNVGTSKRNVAADVDSNDRRRREA